MHIAIHACMYMEAYASQNSACNVKNLIFAVGIECYVSSSVLCLTSILDPCMPWMNLF